MGGEEFISQGAEAHISITTLAGVEAVLKERKPKAYRLPELDAKLRQKRTTQEARCLIKARKAGVLAPGLLLVEPSLGRIYMEKIEGLSAKAWIQAHAQTNPDSARKLVKAMGASVAKLHDNGIVHGDLTTSNFMVHCGPSISTGVIEAKDFHLYVIDFGLAMSVSAAEEKAVDLYVLERAFIASHPQSECLVEALMEQYQISSRHSAATLQRLATVRQRGRKREMLG
jgi:TP53 regulating kinase-like protein